MKKFVLLCLSFLCLLNVAAIFEIYNWVEPEQFKQWLEAKKPMVLVDIQDKPSFAAHHFPGSIETNAFPVESDAERKRLDPAVAAAKKSGQEVVVLCPRGGGGAKRTYDYLKAQGVPEKKLFILTGGVDKWPYRTMLEATK
ncbi:MAG TPA: rhodanese-like domain-containing protein [Desulfurivibrionaceae bacterium]|nr:rhodanese-like domain-containing protein [Desulfurivibrionaceae bacterium]